jgi:hypothetical protein
MNPNMVSGTRDANIRVIAGANKVSLLRRVQEDFLKKRSG